jgi:hypothetical protein
MKDRFSGDPHGKTFASHLSWLHCDSEVCRRFASAKLGRFETITEYFGLSLLAGHRKTFL